MVFKFIGLYNRKYKKINSKVRFVGLKFIPTNLAYKYSTILIASGYGLISASEIESVRRNIKKFFGKNKKAKLLIRIYPYLPFTGKPLEVRMGKGKGSKIRKWASFVMPGKILFEIKNVSNKRAYFYLKKISYKLSINTKIYTVKKRNSVYDF